MNDQHLKVECPAYDWSGACDKKEHYPKIKQWEKECDEVLERCTPYKKGSYAALEIKAVIRELIEQACAEGFKAATLASPDKPDAKEEEKRRILSILVAIRENASIQEIIDRISKDD